MTPICANMVDPPGSVINMNALAVACVKLALPPTDGGVSTRNANTSSFDGHLLEFLRRQGIKPQKAVFQSNEEQKQEYL
jgi:hypothetical protein